VHPNILFYYMFDKLFSWARKKEESQPDVVLGRYSDNNKSVEKVNRWNDADTLFKEKKYPQSIDAFFEYLRDESIENVITERKGEILNFTIYQGSKVVRGNCDDKRLYAEVNLARMPQASIPVMRRLLEQNYLLYYSRYTLNEDRICMRFDSEIASSSPNKLYYGLKELATKADKQDDILVQDFSHLEQIDTDHIEQLSEGERTVKLDYFRQFIRETIDYIDTLDKDKLTGGIAYMLLALGYRIDYLVAPEGNLLHELEKVIGLYFGKEEKTPQEKNQLMVEGYRKMLEKKDEEILPFLFRSTSTFSIVAPQPSKAVYDAITTANQNMLWYRDNKYPEIARQILEYGIAYCQYSFSLPQPLSLLFRLFMEINYPGYFLALGFHGQLFDPASNQFEKKEIEEEIGQIIGEWKEKYPNLEWKAQNIRYDHILSFNQSFLNEIQSLNFEGGK
jgi:hypothetical protein